VVLERTGADPHKLKLELTESLLIDNLSDTIAKMGELKARGVGFSLDDFGTGYSSLSYLKRLPLDQIKIDQSFVNDVLTDPNDAAIARTIVALGHSLGLIVIAEGVETEQQRDFLAQYGCDAYQGFLYSLPLPAEQFLAFMRNR
jgi:EAL domain-containing protein (putative c-di-GMP-specific phosphodiesterase class I)